jgi:hypothetical protein
MKGAQAMRKGFSVSLSLITLLTLVGAASRADDEPPEELETDRARWQEAIVAAKACLASNIKIENPKGPGGTIVRSARRPSTIHNTSHTRQSVAWNEVQIPMEARVGTGDRADRRRYDYVLYMTVNGPKGNRVAEVGHHRAAVNGTDDPETGCVLVFQGNHEPGKYKVEVSLCVVDTAHHKAVLLDRGDCTFTIDPGPPPPAADTTPAKPLPR